MITKQCDVVGCKTPFVHRLWSILLLPVKAPRELQHSAGKVEYRLCVKHFNEAMDGR